jgi:hypothetical protein
MRFASSCAANQNEVMYGFHEGDTGQLFELRLLQRGFAPVEACQIPVNRKLGGFELVTQACSHTVQLQGFQSCNPVNAGHEHLHTAGHSVHNPPGASLAPRQCAPAVFAQNFSKKTANV